LLDLQRVSITPPIRHRLLTVVFLGVVTSGLSLVALVRMLSTATTQRIERARDSVAEETARLAQAAAAGSERRELLGQWPRSQVMGMRGGFVEGGAKVAGPLPEPWRPLVDDAVHQAAARGQAAATERHLADGRVVVSARPVGDGTFAWAAWQVRTPPYLDNWRWIVLALSVVTLLLVATAVHAVVTVKSSAAALNGALAALATDLSTPVPRPPVRELSDIAEGVAALARRLATAREAEKRLGRELARQERLAALGRVVAGVAHEVRNPLASIKLRLDLAVANESSASPPLPAFVEQAISHASAEIARLDRLVADLLLVAGRSLGPQRRTDLAQLVRDRVAALAPWAQLRGIEMRIEGSASAEIDCDSVGRALDNLLRNAVEASPPGGTVSVLVEEKGAEVHLRVEDRGTGVAGDRAAELFEPFFTTKADGTGLGLAICRAIARAHGGDVVYGREAGVTRFELTLPRRLPPGEPARETPAREAVG
jgi:signal transduction histidine kinase